jgi:hypothetical protein
LPKDCAHGPRVLDFNNGGCYNFHGIEFKGVLIMALVTSTEMFKKAYNGGYAIGAFNVNNMEIIQGITEAAIEEKAPLILQVSSGARKYAKHVYLRTRPAPPNSATSQSSCAALTNRRAGRRFWAARTPPTSTR